MSKWYACTEPVVTPMLNAVGAKTYITGLNGQVQVVSDGKGYTVTQEHEAPPVDAPKK